MTNQARQTRPADPAQKAASKPPAQRQAESNPAWARLALSLQPKLKTSSPSDALEHEADATAERVMRMSTPQIQRQCAACAAGGPPCAKCADEARSKAESSTDAPSVSGNSLQGLGEGRPLDSASRAFFEPRFGQGFSQVRVHDGGAAAASARALRARAFTYGGDVVFAPGEYAPATQEGRRLLAHELTHVIQQRRGREAAPRGTVQAKALTPDQVEVQASSKTAGTPMTKTISADDMKRIYPMLGQQKPDIIKRYTDLSNRTFAIFKMDTIESRAFFFAQAFAESGQFSHMVEGDIDPTHAYVEQQEGGADRDPFYTDMQRSEFKKRYKDNTDINRPKDRLPANWSGPKTDENYAYVGRGPVQVTGRRNYEQACGTMEHWAKVYEKEGDPPGIKATDLPGTGATVHERLKSAAQAIRQNPALAGDPDYAFLLSGAFLKMGWYGSTDTSKDAISIDVLATRTQGQMTPAAMYGKSGHMHGKAGVKWPTDAASEAEFKKAWGADADLIKANFTAKANEYNRIRGILMEIEGVSDKKP